MINGDTRIVHIILFTCIPRFVLRIVTVRVPCFSADNFFPLLECGGKNHWRKWHKTTEEETEHKFFFTKNVNRNGVVSDFNGCRISVFCLTKASTSASATLARLFCLYLPRIPCAIVYFLILERSPVRLTFKYALELHQRSLEPKQDWGLADQSSLFWFDCAFTPQTNQTF